MTIPGIPSPLPPLEGGLGVSGRVGGAAEDGAAALDGHRAGGADAAPARRVAHVDGDGGVAALGQLIMEDASYVSC